MDSDSRDYRTAPRGQHAKPTPKIVVTLVACALGMILPSSTWALSFDFSILSGTDNVVSGTFTSAKSDNWTQTDLDTLEFKVDANYDLAATLFNSPGFDGSVGGHDLIAFTGNIAGGITSLSARIQQGSRRDEWFYPFTSTICKGTCIGATSDPDIINPPHFGVQVIPIPNVSSEIAPAAVPEPTTMMLFVTGLLRPSRVSMAPTTTRADPSRVIHPRPIATIGTRRHQAPKAVMVFGVLAHQAGVSVSHLS